MNGTGRDGDAGVVAGRDGAAADAREGVVVIVMGVSGCGKSTVATALAARLDAHVRDGDELHPKSNIEKMSSGVPLTDEDRWPWLAAVRDYAARAAREHGLCVIACSALKRRYRELLDEAGSVFYVFLDGSYELILSRMQDRAGHFMPASMLTSQFEALERPDAEPNVVTVGIRSGPERVADAAARALRAHPGFAAAVGERANANGAGTRAGAGATGGHA